MNVLDAERKMLLQEKQQKEAEESARVAREEQNVNIANIVAAVLEEKSQQIAAKDAAERDASNKVKLEAGAAKNAKWYRRAWNWLND